MAKKRTTITPADTETLRRVYHNGVKYEFDPPIEVVANEPIEIEQNEDGTWQLVEQ